MRKALIYTLYGNYNYGNKLQNYAVQEILKENNIEANTVILKKMHELNFKRFIKNIIKYFIPSYRRLNKKSKMRLNNFIKFDKLIKKISFANVELKNIDFIFVGSDQVWNPFDKLSQQLVEEINKINGKNIISFAASIAAEEIPSEFSHKYKQQFLHMNSISVREYSGKKIIELFTKKNDVEILLDPTMLLPIYKWEELISKPENLEENNIKKGKYILNYFLGSVSDERYNVIKNIAKVNDCEIINILDKNSPFYSCGPDEFLYLEKNAFFICTDSFHSCVFSILFKTPFLVFNREDKCNNMNSRIETLLDKFELGDRIYSNENTSKIFECDFSKVDRILNEERKKSVDFINRAINMKNGG